MQRPYPTTRHNVILSALLLTPLLATGQAMKPVAANDFCFNAFKLPPFPVEVMHVAPAPGGGVTLTTFMPIAGRALPMGETPKPKGALFPSNASYLQTLTLGPDTKPITSAPGVVFGPGHDRQAPQPVGDVDWAVFGTNATDGPQRLPYGGDFGQMATRFPQMGIPAVLSVQPKLIDNGRSGVPVGAGGKVHMAYPQRVAFLDPITGKLGIRAETPTPLVAESQRKTTGYAPPINYRYAQPLNLANGQTEALVNQANESDKNAPFRQFHLLRYDNGGNLLHDAPVQFAYNRSFFTRCPLVDAEGQVVGAVNIFGDGDGKKEFMDPDENRVAVVVTDEQGAIWAQFDWTVNGSAMRAAEPLLARREGETVKLWTFNTQKMLKPQYESWT